ncbi:DUF3152 domain-containing protein [Streptomyces sp. ISL-12]|uniref:DUF3152 domain-containing protein n=1 Tax=Streptomyces sp. ISL-12 TaxID=2819177 RepID=UPI0027B8BCDC|nr:DUF3152 domain-containing protein [Streptomyces sp. ISL-12]
MRRHLFDRTKNLKRGRLNAALLGCALLALVPLTSGCQGQTPPADDAVSTPPDVPTAQARPAKTPRPTPSTATPTPTVPLTGSGEFTTAQESLGPVGSGTPMRYRVQVETSLDLSLADTAREINSVLADPRGWTAGGQAFQLVSSEPAELTVQVASPGTVDATCGAAGLDTQGEVNCSVGSVVVVNLKRWMLGSPQFDGSLHDYRALIINHEVGHRLGHGHETCPGEQRPAPVMMQQIKGLHGCTANAWPYDSDGVYISGPPTA